MKKAKKQTKKTATPRVLAPRPVSDVALAHTQPSLPEHPLAILERVARYKSVDPDKLGKLIELHKDVLRVQAKIEFDQAFSALAIALPTITKRGKIVDRGGKVKYRYARLGEDIQSAVKPVLAAHGFAIRHRTEWPSATTVRVIGVLSHRSGHSEESQFEAPADQSEYRSHVQSLGSTVSYGRRYTTIDLLNLTVHGVDDDGEQGVRSEPPHQTAGHVPPAPADGPITQDAADRLETIIMNSGRDIEDVTAWLLREFQWRSTRQVSRALYGRVCATIAAPGQLPSDVLARAALQGKK